MVFQLLCMDGHCAWLFSWLYRYCARQSAEQIQSLLDFYLDLNLGTWGHPGNKRQFTLWCSFKIGTWTLLWYPGIKAVILWWRGSHSVIVSMSWSVSKDAGHGEWLQWCPRRDLCKPIAVLARCNFLVTNLVWNCGFVSGRSYCHLTFIALTATVPL